MIALHCLVRYMTVMWWQSHVENLENIVACLLVCMLQATVYLNEQPSFEDFMLRMF